MVKSVLHIRLGLRAGLRLGISTQLGDEPFKAHLAPKKKESSEFRTFLLVISER